MQHAPDPQEARALGALEGGDILTNSRRLNGMLLAVSTRAAARRRWPRAAVLLVPIVSAADVLSDDSQIVNKLMLVADHNDLRNSEQTDVQPT